MTKPLRLLFGTTNESKVATMSHILRTLPVSLYSLSQLSEKLPPVEEGGNSPLQNARLKATAYYQAFQIPVFSCDSGLFVKELPPHRQPGVYVRRVEDRELTDEEMIDYYSSLAKEYGPLTASYQNAICFVWDENHIFESAQADLGGQPFILTDTPHPARKPGFPLDSLSVDIQSGAYYFDLPPSRPIGENILEQAFVRFFQQALKTLGLLPTV